MASSVGLIRWSRSRTSFTFIGAGVRNCRLTAKRAVGTPGFTPLDAIVLRTASFHGPVPVVEYDAGRPATSRVTRF